MMHPWKMLQVTYVVWRIMELDDGYLDLNSLNMQCDARQGTKLRQPKTLNDLKLKHKRVQAPLYYVTFREE